jgi:hypothetical protein
MMQRAFRARPVAVLAFAALLLGANLEPAVGIVREGDRHQETIADPARLSVAMAPVANPTDAASLVRAPAPRADDCGSAGDHCAHAHGYSLPAIAAPVRTTDGHLSAVLWSDAADSCPVDRSVRPPIR